MSVGYQGLTLQVGAPVILALGAALHQALETVAAVQEGHCPRT